jgi:hypothetical protein
LADVAPKARRAYRQRVQVEEPHELRRHPTPLRATLLAAWAARRSGELTDNLVETLGGLRTTKPGIRNPPDR